MAKEGPLSPAEVVPRHSPRKGKTWGPGDTWDGTHRIEALCKSGKALTGMLASGRRRGHLLCIPCSTAPEGQGVPPSLCFESRSRSPEHRDGLARGNERPPPSRASPRNSPPAPQGVGRIWNAWRLGARKRAGGTPRVQKASAALAGGLLVGRHQLPPVLLPEL